VELRLQALLAVQETKAVIHQLKVTQAEQVHQVQVVVHQLLEQQAQVLLVVLVLLIHIQAARLLMQ
jgi:hypothetical protein